MYNDFVQFGDIGPIVRPARGPQAPPTNFSESPLVLKIYLLNSNYLRLKLAHYHWYTTSYLNFTHILALGALQGPQRPVGILWGP
jgi:hypothetical protein